MKLNLKPNKYSEKIKLWIKDAENNDFIELDKKETLKHINMNYWKNSTGLRLFDKDDFFKAIIDSSKLTFENTNRILYYSLDSSSLY